MDSHSDRWMMLPLRQHSEGLGSPLTRISARAQALGHMLKEEGRGEEEEEEKIGGVVSRRLRAEMTAVAEEWQRWQAQETEVRRAAEEALRASDAWRAAEERCEAAGDAADRAGERAREARALAERACLDRHPRRAIAVRRLRSAAEEELNACLAADADGDAADEASEALAVTRPTLASRLPWTGQTLRANVCGMPNRGQRGLALWRCWRDCGPRGAGHSGARRQSGRAITGWRSALTSACSRRRKTARGVA